MIHVAQRIADELDAGTRTPTSSACSPDGGWKYLSLEAWAEDLAVAEKGVEESLWWCRTAGASTLSDARPIGVFDSGVGGLTVARAIIDQLPNESLVYVGDTARFPYGPRPGRRDPAVRARDRGLARARDVKMLVVACNSVEVSAIDDIASAAGVPVVGVIDPGVRAAVRATETRRDRHDRDRGDRRERRLRARRGGRGGSACALHAAACPVFVDHVERGDTTSLALGRPLAGILCPS